MTTVFLKVISGILQQHEELLRKYKQRALKLKEYDGIFLKARTTGGRTYFAGHRHGKKPKYIGNEKHTTVQRIQNLRAAELSLDTAQKWYQKLLELKDSMPVKYPEKCTVSTIDGTLVRSRIEAIIYDHMVSAGLLAIWYRSNFCIKTVELASLGFVLGKNILTTFEDGGGTIDTEKIDKMIQREFFTSPTVQEKTTGVNPEEFLKQQMQAQAAARIAG